MRIQITNTGVYHFPGMAEIVLQGYTEKTKEVLTYYNHTF